MKIYTKTGDTGKTSLLDGKRVSKANLRIDAYGTVDELNAFIGLLKDQEINQNKEDVLKEIQDRLFCIGAALASVSEKKSNKDLDVKDRDVLYLEEEIDKMQGELEPLRNFILPGGHSAISFCHLARTVCRRAERCVIALHELEPLDEIIIVYLNRLSDYLFVLGRLIAKELDIKEVIWKPRV